MTLNAGTYEAQIIELLGDRGDVVRYTVADATAISKGTVMELRDPRTIVKSTTRTAYPNPIAGIAVSDKVANDGSTTMGVYTYGIFEMRCDEGKGISVGDYVCVSGANNQVRVAAAADVISGAVLGKALEHASDDEEFAVLVKVS